MLSLCHVPLKDLGSLERERFQTWVHFNVQVVPFRSGHIIWTTIFRSILNTSLNIVNGRSGSMGR